MFQGDSRNKCIDWFMVDSTLLSRFNIYTTILGGGWVTSEVSRLDARTQCCQYNTYSDSAILPT